MRIKDYLNRSIAAVGTPLSLLTTLAATPLVIPIALPLIFLALVITLLLVLLALLLVLLVLLVLLLKQLPQLLQAQQIEKQPRLVSEGSKPPHSLEQSDSKPVEKHVRNSSTSSSAKRRTILNTPEFSHHRTGSCHESEADSMSIAAPIYNFATNGPAFGIDSPRKKH